jgi:hypothetical protein
VLPGIYLIGSLEKGVTVYNQQLRAHNLAWAIWERHKARSAPRIAVVGGGITGLTTTACLLSLFKNLPTATVTVFERLWDLCPLQQGSDARWLHPKIYNWPQAGSRAPSASLPVLNWSEGRASDVVRSMLREFSKFCNSFGGDTRLAIYLGLRHFQIDARTKQVSWVGMRANRAGAFFHVGKPEGGDACFDVIVLATGFGLESQMPGYPTASYWRNEQMAQPLLSGSRRAYLISGFGDGALVDLGRLTIERFRQDTIIYELFARQLPDAEEALMLGIEARGAEANMFELFCELEGGILAPAKMQLQNRIRKDTNVTLHLTGRANEVKTLSQIFGRTSSFLNRLLTFLLFRCGAFALDFAGLEPAVVRSEAGVEDVVCRYGADTISHLKALFVSPGDVEARLLEMKQQQKQVPIGLWPPGLFPHY